MKISFLKFYEQVSDLPAKFKNRDLEVYLLALYGLVEQNKEKEMNAGLMLELLSKAFTEKPLSFNPDWLSRVTPPDGNIMSQKFTNPEFKDSIDKTPQVNEEGIDYTLRVIEFQVAELHKMKNKQLKDEYRYFGIDSETGNRWYNFDPHLNLECGARCLVDSAESEEDQFHPTWQSLGELLEMGRIYE
jgi:hypothetical protein